LDSGLGIGLLIFGFHFSLISGGDHFFHVRSPKLLKFILEQFWLSRIIEQTDFFNDVLPLFWRLEALPSLNKKLSHRLHHLLYKLPTVVIGRVKTENVNIIGDKGLRKYILLLGDEGIQNVREMLECLDLVNDLALAVFLSGKLNMQADIFKHWE